MIVFLMIENDEEFIEDPALLNRILKSRKIYTSLDRIYNEEDIENSYVAEIEILNTDQALHNLFEILNNSNFKYNYNKINEFDHIQERYNKLHISVKVKAVYSRTKL